MIKVSIITVTYNAASTLEDCINSVLDQNYPNIEYIIVDGQSTDDTLKIVEKYKSRISKCVSEKDKGLYDALNKGISMASGEVIGILHADDFYISNHVISDYVNVFEREKCEAVYADLYYVDKLDTAKIKRKWKSGIYKPGSFVYGWMPPHPTFFVKKEVYEKYGYFNLELKSAADYELMLRFIHKYKIKISYLPEFVVKMRTGGKSNASFQNRLKANSEDKRAWELNRLKPKFYTLYFKPLRKLLQFM